MFNKIGENIEREEMFSNYFMGKDTDKLYGFATKDNVFITNNYEVFKAVSDIHLILQKTNKIGYRLLSAKDISDIKLSRTPKKYDAIARFKCKKDAELGHRAISIVLLSNNTKSINGAAYIMECVMHEHLMHSEANSETDNQKTIPPCKIKIATENNVFMENFVKKKALIRGITNMHQIFNSVMTHSASNTATETEAVEENE